MQRGKFIVLEGIDGAGKSTQVALLRKALGQIDLVTEHIHFPRLDTPVFGDLISAYLRGELGALDAIDPRLVSLLYAEDRREFAPAITSWLEEGRYVIADRYVYSNIAFQTAKCTTEEARSKLTDWILNLEYTHFALPRPDVSFYLDIRTQSAAHAIREDRGREDRAYLAGAADIHETNRDFQERVRLEYLRLANADMHFHLIPGNTPDGERKAPEVVHQKILGHLNLKIS